LNKLLVLGINIVIASILLLAYGLVMAMPSVIGVSMSMAVIGGVIAVYSSLPRDPEAGFLLSYVKTLVNGLTAAIEDLDLLDAHSSIVRSGAGTLLIVSRAPCVENVDPGLGFSQGSPYIAIPLESLSTVFEGVSAEDVESFLRAVLVDELSICRAVSVSVEGNIYRVALSGLSDLLKEFTRYPLDPYTVVTLLALSRVAGARCVRLVDRSVTPEGVVLAVGVEV